MLVLKLISRSLSLVISVVLARILQPEAFGLVAVGLLVLMIVQSLGSFGMTDTLVIDSKEEFEVNKNVVWTFDFVVSMLICGVIISTSRQLAQLLGEEESVEIIQVLSLVPVIRALNNIELLRYRRNLEFKFLFIHDVYGAVIQAIMAISFALLIRNEWAIVFGILANEITRVIVSYRLQPILPKLQFDWGILKSKMNFGVWLWLGSLVSIVAMELDSVMVSRRYDAVTMGFYTLSFTLTNRPVQELGKALTQVLFPALVTTRNHEKSFTQSYIRFFTAFFLLIIPIPLVSFFFSEEIVGIALGQKWLPIIPLVKVLSLAVVFRVLALPSAAVYKSCNAPKFIPVLGGMRAMTLVLMLYLFDKENQLLSVPIAVLSSNVVLWIFTLVTFSKLDSIKFTHVRNNAIILLFCAVVIFALAQIIELFVLMIHLKILLFSFMYILLLYSISRLSGYSWIKDYFYLVFKPMLK